MSTIKQVLNSLHKLAQLQAQRSEMTADIDQKIAELEAEKARICTHIDDDIKKADFEARERAATLNETVQGDVLQAVISIRHIWDSNRLLDMALMDPQILQAHTASKVVSIKAVGKSKK